MRWPGFALAANGSTVRTEVLAGATTFLTMAYIVFVNPDILATTGMDHGAVFVATCLAAALGSLLMGVLANYPIGMAPGMGLNAFFAFSVVGTLDYSWQQTLGLVFVSGCIFLLLTVTGARRWLVDGIPPTLRSAIAVGIGLFLALIGLQKAGLVVAHPQTLLTLGDLHRPEPLLALAGLLLIGVLELRRVRGAMLLGILAVTVTALALGLVHYTGVLSLPPSLAPTLLQLDIVGALHGHGGSGALATVLHVVLVFVLVEMFDATGTLMGVAQRAGLLHTPAQRHQFDRALLADSTAILAGSLLGTSSTTAYVESAAGVQVGGRTGLTALVVAGLFLLALLFSPLAAMVPAYATAPALIYLASVMLRECTQIQWDDVGDALPAAICMLAMPLTYSIATGLAFGFITYAALRLGSGRWRGVHPATWAIAGLFVLRYALE
ncbi:NCS2 family permease [Xanthomonas vasicola]|uniref:NCS2 family permease n=1 Tax=Xanthomonas vasicola TaxID=56459 RepID=UPI0001CC084A|nr:NCS2 family permease [Xanthomonas vasicola]AZR28832.1 NCS2 family permease [Xanthomonas vasicola pv. arecae]AZR32786.1 NCS2 family permease [Xanthomonas vasicola pv. musacearum NCPPB 4379]KFA05991.1 guanine permease [Xanthomonas vasicola pv. musacearum NCPPB 2005]KFA07530.1 guanine permease [Xanthomonas vasicola pv. musacearum NCPPB 4380]KFA18608.1 guanine permease [Xanthomonas vasicola pv. musacearum NCPPB 4392]